MLTHENLRRLAVKRLNEAKALRAAGEHDGALYMAGYSIEMALKARICRHLKMANYPADDGDKNRKIFATHDFDLLALLGGISDKMNLGTPNLGTNWSIVIQWGPERRYAPVGSATRQDVDDLINAIESNPHGVLTWIKRRW